MLESLALYALRTYRARTILTLVVELVTHSNSLQNLIDRDNEQPSGAPESQNDANECPTIPHGTFEHIASTTGIVRLCANDGGGQQGRLYVHHRQAILRHLFNGVDGHIIRARVHRRSDAA